MSEVLLWYSITEKCFHCCIYKDKGNTNNIYEYMLAKVKPKWSVSSTFITILPQNIHALGCLLQDLPKE